MVFRKIGGRELGGLILILRMNGGRGLLPWLRPSFKDVQLMAGLTGEATAEAASSQLGDKVSSPEWARSRGSSLVSDLKGSSSLCWTPLEAILVLIFLVSTPPFFEACKSKFVRENYVISCLIVRFIGAYAVLLLLCEKCNFGQLPTPLALWIFGNAFRVSCEKFAYEIFFFWWSCVLIRVSGGIPWDPN